MPRRKEILNNLSNDLISMQIYPVSFDFNPDTEFEKWAVVEVSDFDPVPGEMKTFLLPGGHYVVIQQNGASNGNSIFR